MSKNNQDCLDFLEQIRWDGKPKCPYCESSNYRILKNERRYQCNDCYTSYSVTVGTLFHKTHLDLEKWFLAIRLVLNSATGISVRQLAQEVGVNKNTAHYMIERIHKANTEDPELLQKLIAFNPR